MKKLFIAVIILVMLICNSASSFDTPGLSLFLAKDAETVNAFFHGGGDKNQASSSYPAYIQILNPFSNSSEDLS